MYFDQYDQNLKTKRTNTNKYYFIKTFQDHQYHFIDALANVIECAVHTVMCSH